MRILVTGANGFVGRALCAALGLQGHLVRSVTRTLPDRLEIPSFAVANIGPDTDWSAAITRCDAIIHLAAHVHVMRRQARDVAGDFHRAGYPETRGYSGSGGLVFRRGSCGRGHPVESASTGHVRG